MLAGTQLSINTHGGIYGCYLEVLERTHEQLSAMFSYHSRVMILFFQLYPAEYTNDNKLLSKALLKLKKKLVKQYGFKRIGYLWAREWNKQEGRTDRHHYHCALFLDGNKVRHPKNVLQLVERTWQSFKQPKPYIPKKCYRMIHRNDRVAYQEVFYRLSYFAKVSSKGNRPPSTNDYSCSRIKAKEQPTSLMISEKTWAV